MTSSLRYSIAISLAKFDRCGYFVVAEKHTCEVYTLLAFGHVRPGAKARDRELNAYMISYGKQDHWFKPVCDIEA